MSAAVWLINSDTDLDNYSAYNYFIVDASGGSVTVTFPDILADGMTFNIRRIDANLSSTVTLRGKNSEVINGSGLIAMKPGSWMVPVSYNTAWTTSVVTACSSNISTGTAVLVAGSATVTTPFAHTASVIQLTNQVTGGLAGTLSVGTRVDGVSFQIASSSLLDASTIGWTIFNNV